MAREEEDAEYIALSYPATTIAFSPSSATATLPRVVWKQSKIDVEADEDMTGKSAKLELYKSRLLHTTGKVVVKTDWNDVHVYALAPWIRQLLVTRTRLASFQQDLLPLLIARQFKGKRATFGSSLDEGEHQGEEDMVEPSPAPSPTLAIDENPFEVLALVDPDKTILRASTIPAYLYACTKVVAHGDILTIPQNSKWNGKFQSLVLEGSTLGAKITMRATVIGNDCALGDKCRLNNVVVMDSVTIGENCSLQNTIVAAGAVLGNNCSLSDCQVGPNKHLAAGTKDKGESFLVGDAIAEELL